MTLPGPLVDGQWLAANLSAVNIADVRWSLEVGARHGDYQAGHIPGAVFVDLDADLSDTPGPRGRHPLPTAAAFVDVLSGKQLLDKPVVCYDDAGGGVAARLWWMLDVLGFEAAVLDGGIADWPGELQQGRAHDQRTPQSNRDWQPPALDSVTWPDGVLVSLDEMIEAVGSGGTAIVDARSTTRFNGEPNAVDDPAGHMPGANSRPWQANLDQDLRFRSPIELARQLSEVGATGSDSWIATCGSGVSACHNLLAARVAGVEGGRLYVGSWSEWIQDPSRPVATSQDAG